MKQEIFSTVFRGLASQNFERSINSPSDNEVPRCMYRDEQGRKCAAGWLIPDSEYQSRMEGCVARSIPYIREKFGEQIGTIMELQRLHDNARSPAEILDRLCEYARAHNLEIPECPTSSEQ